ncbi:MAG: hypothetical protein ACOCYT_02095 [Chloroflexota bacterium]
MRNRTRNFLIAIVIMLGLFVALALDLANRGLFWQFAWSVSGEETPIAQVRGVVEWMGNALRPQPQTNPMTPIAHTGENPYGINTFLEQEVEAEKVDAKLGMIADAGFAWIRQQFIWEDIEIHAKGDFVDRRNDRNGDGVITEADYISSWEKYDLIVDLTEDYGLRIQARLDNPPNWSRAEPVSVTGAFAPPDDYQDFVDFAVTVAERYRGRIHYYQVWNEPNIFPEWGNYPVSPEDYTRLLCMTHDALKQVDPEIVVITGALAPTQALTRQNLNDFIFLQRMYQAGAADCFDILSVQGYGLNSGPTDRRMRSTVVNIARNLYIRDIMVANGDSHKPIWISEAAWNFVPSREEAPDIAEPRTMFGQVTPQQAADYIPLLYERAMREWPWVGVVNYWFFSRRDDSERNQPFYYFRMVDPDYNPDAELPFPPLPVYYAMREHIATVQPTLYFGVHQADGHWAIDADDPVAVAADGAQFGQSLQADALRFIAHGTQIVVRWRGDMIEIRAGERARQEDAEGTGWQTTVLDLGLRAESHAVTVTGSGPLLVDSITVVDRTETNLFPVVAVVGITLFMLALAILDGLRLRRERDVAS